MCSSYWNCALCGSAGAGGSLERLILTPPLMRELYLRKGCCASMSNVSRRATRKGCKIVPGSHILTSILA